MDLHAMILKCRHFVSAAKITSVHPSIFVTHAIRGSRIFRAGAVLGILLLVLSPCVARDIFVSPKAGDDAGDGSAAAPEAGGHGPVKSIKAAMKLAHPGDTIHLDPACSPYYEPVIFADISGTEEAPIVFDGHGATIDGTVPLIPSEWEDVGQGLFKSTVIAQTYCYKANPAYTDRFFFMQDGKMNRMGRSLKGSKTPFKRPDQLAPGEWTWVDAEKAFYLKIPPGADLASQGIRLPKIVTGVQITGQCHYLTIRNVTVTHVINDGYGLTVGPNKDSTVRAIRYENIAAIECGDDGLSAHGDCEVTVDGFLSRANSTGYCSQGKSVNTRVRIEDIDGVEIYPLGGTHEFTDTIAIGHALRPVVLEPATIFKTTELILKNCLILGADGRNATDSIVRIMPGGTLKADRVTFSGVSFLAYKDSSVEIQNSVLAGGGLLQILPTARWSGSGNTFDFQNYQLGDTRFPGSAFDQFASAVGEANSRQLPLGRLSPSAPPAGLPSGAGADFTSLPKAR